MGNIKPQFVLPCNSDKVSDAVYWFLRSVQNIFEVGQPYGMHVAPPTLESRILKEPYKQEEVNIGNIINWPAIDNTFENHLIILDEDKKRIHLLRGGRSNIGRTFYLKDDIISAASVGLDSLYILTGRGCLFQISVLQLNSRVDNIGLPPLNLQDMVHLEMPNFYTQKKNEKIFLACPVNGKKDTVLLVNNNLTCVLSVDQIDGRLQKREVIVEMSWQQRDGLDIVNVVGFDERIVLHDNNFSRLYYFNPTEKIAKIRSICGDRVVNKRGSDFGIMPADGRIPKATSLCYFKLSSAAVDDVVACIRFHHNYKIEIPSDTYGVRNLKKNIIESSGFFVFFDATARKVFTCSHFTYKKMEKYFSADSMKLLPLYVPQLDSINKVRDGFSILGDIIGEFDGVAQGPDSSLMFWRKGSSKILLLHSMGDTFLRMLKNKNHMDELNKIIGRGGWHVQSGS